MSDATTSSPDAGFSGPSTASRSRDVVVVSNRQPYRHSREDGSVAVDQPTGGLVAGLDPMMQRIDGTWVAWGDGDADREVTDEDGTVAVPPEDPSYTLARVWLDEDEVDDYYYGYSNRALWPLCHSDLSRAHFDADEWEAYRSVNREFAETVVERADDGLVWFQDYHFALAPRHVSEATDASVMQFWHVPWPAPDVFRACPQRRELLHGLLGNDRLSFHVQRYADNFLACVDELLPEATVDPATNRVRYEGETTQVDASPLGIDAEAFREAARRSDDAGWEAFCRDHGVDPARQVVVGVDRLDYTKGIPERLDALEHLWETRPELRGQFTYVQKGCESRTRISEYRKLQTRIEERIGQINDRFGTDDWTPIAYTTERLPRRQLCGLYRRSDVGLVTPLRDGMNLVSQEYVACQVDDPGVLVLSHLAGAHDTFGDSALTVDPRDTPAHAETIAAALSMPADERRRRMGALRAHVHEHDLDDWIDGQLDAAGRVGRRP